METAALRPSFSRYWGHMWSRLIMLPPALGVWALAWGMRSMFVGLLVALAVLIVSYLNVFHRQVEVAETGIRVKRALAGERLISYESISQVHRFHGKTEGEDAHAILTVVYGNNKKLRFNSLHWPSASLAHLVQVFRECIPERVTRVSGRRLQSRLGRATSAIYAFYEAHVFLFMLIVMTASALLVVGVISILMALGV